MKRLIVIFKCDTDPVPNLSASYMVIRFLFSLLLLILLAAPSPGQSFEEGKYGGDFLSVGGGARPLGMGSAFTSVTGDVLSGYWNPAGLSQVRDWQFAYMHSERFSGVVGYDYGAIAMPVQGSDGVVALSFFRQGVDGINNPCPAGYRLPTEAEWNAEVNSWISNNPAGAIASSLKLPMAGGRSRSSGSLFSVSANGFYWSSTVSGSGARRLGFSSGPAYMYNDGRALGVSVRCIKD